MEETKECSTELIPAPTHELYVSVDGGERQFVRSFTLAQEMGDDADEEDDSSMTAGAGAVPVPPPARRFGVCFSPEWRTFKKTAWAVFDTQEEAAEAYNIKVREVYGGNGTFNVIKRQKIASE